MPTRSRPARRPSPKAVVLGSLALFAVLYALLAFQLLERGTAKGDRASASAPTLTDALPVGLEDDDSSDEDVESASPPVVTSSS